MRGSPAPARRSPALARRALCAAVVAALAAAGCENVPFVPRWDVDVYVPLQTSIINLGDSVPTGVLLPGLSSNVASQPDTQDLSGGVGDILSQTLRRLQLSFRVTNTTPIGGNVSLSIADSSANSFSVDSAHALNFEVSLAQTLDTGVVTLYTFEHRLPDDSSAALVLLNRLARNEPKWLIIYSRGTIRNTSTGNVVVTNRSVIKLAIALTVRVAASRD